MKQRVVILINFVKVRSVATFGKHDVTTAGDFPWFQVSKISRFYAKPNFIFRFLSKSTSTD